MKRLSTHKVEDIIFNIGINTLPIVLNGISVKTSTTRLRTFVEKGLVCRHCGMVGKFFAVEYAEASGIQTAHLNLYGINDQGNEVLMTSDHIMPISKGGNKKSIHNRQCLCTVCNMKKGNKI